VEAADHQRVVGGDDELPLLGADVVLEQLEEVIGPNRVEVGVRLVEQIKRLVVLGEQQQAEHRQELLLALAHLGELHPRPVGAFDGDANLVDQIAEKQALQITEQGLRVLPRLLEPGEFRFVLDEEIQAFGALPCLRTRAPPPRCCGSARVPGPTADRGSP